MVYKDDNIHNSDVHPSNVYIVAMPSKIVPNYYRNYHEKFKINLSILTCLS